MNPFQLSTTLVFHIFISLLPNEKQRAAVFLGDSPETQFAISASSEKFNARWNVMFERLQKYKEERGDCVFPQKYEEDPQLGKCVSHQRSISTVDDKMEQEHRDKLNSI
jgi:hypothetical protein